MTLTRAEYHQALADPVTFARLGGRALRSYQQEVARAVVDSVLHQRGLSFAVMFPRQSGKNELQAQIEVCLLVLLQHQDADIVKISPTWRPQSLNAMRRLERALEAHPLACRLWSKESGYIYRVGRARISFLSGAPEASIVGATASHLLEVDEAQDVGLDKFDRDIAPMAAATNATRVYWGTAWTSQTLLAREVRAAQENERAALENERAAQANQLNAGVRLAYTLSAETVAQEVPAYGAFVAGQVARLGRNHPLVRTQLFSEEIDGQCGMFPPGRIALMQGAHAAQDAPLPGRVYAMLLDVAGEIINVGVQQAASQPAEHQQKLDFTALTIVEVDLGTLADPLLRAPTYRAVARRVWQGASHAQLYGEIRALAETWRARWLVVDATGVGAGLASFLARALPGRVLPFLFNLATKSRLGWDFLALVDAGRWKEPAAADDLSRLFLRQCAFTQYEVLPGPGRSLRWSVPDGARDPASGALLHDDLVLSAALAAVLDRQPWRAALAAGGVVPGRDPLDEMRGY